MHSGDTEGCKLFDILSRVADVAGVGKRHIISIERKEKVIRCEAKVGLEEGGLVNQSLCWDRRDTLNVAERHVRQVANGQKLTKLVGEKDRNAL